jgi:hypothetical protein
MPLPELAKIGVFDAIVFDVRAAPHSKHQIFSLIVPHIFPL